jgi:LmbE family N-acetylglucosaminyl deacetylase
VATWDPSGGYGHPDHIAVHHHATAAYHAAADASRYAAAGAPWKTPALYYNVIPIEEFYNLAEELRKRGVDMGEAPGGNENLASLPRLQANCAIDVSAQYERKRRALLAHRTQISDTEVFANLPEDLAMHFFGREWFPWIRPNRDGEMLDDLLSALH